ncbi:MAG TPA: phosphotransferase [Actinopolymorphaceae bacterium]
MLDVAALARRFAVERIEPITLGMSAASVHRLVRPGRAALFLKQGPPPDVADEVARLSWLESVGFGCPSVVEAGPGWMLTAGLRGRDAAQPWPAHERDAVLDAFADALLALHALDASACPFPTRYPAHALSVGLVVTHGDFCCPNVLIDPGSLAFTGVLDVGWLGVGDAYIDVATTVMTLGGDLNPQYRGAVAVERVLRRVGADPSDPRIADCLAFYRKP